MPYIYKITNKISQKIYIGKTVLSIEARWQQHCLDAYKPTLERRPLYSAIRKYGKENFIVECLEECLVEEISNKEKFYIDFFQSYSNGYNATIGGDGKSYINPDDIYEDWLITENLAETARRLNHDPQWCSKLLKDNFNIIVNSSDTIKKKYSKPVSMFSKDNKWIQDFPSAIEAQRWAVENGHSQLLDVRKHHISSVCNGKRKTTNGFIYKWKVNQ